MSPLQIFGVAVMLGFAAFGALLASWLFVAILAYGLFGHAILPPSPRVAALAFSLTFVVVAGIGWTSWVINKFKDTRP